MMYFTLVFYVTVLLWTINSWYGFLTFTNLTYNKMAILILCLVTVVFPGLLFILS